MTYEGHKIFELGHISILGGMAFLSYKLKEGKTFHDLMKALIKGPGTLGQVNVSEGVELEMQTYEGTYEFDQFLINMDTILEYLSEDVYGEGKITILGTVNEEPAWIQLLVKSRAIIFQTKFYREIHNTKVSLTLFTNPIESD